VNFISLFINKILRFPIYLFPYSNIKKLHATLIDARKALDNEKIPYMFAYGTALGVHRNGDLIPWDDDIDLAIFYEDITDSNSINSAMKKNDFLPRFPGKSDPFSWICEGEKYPVLFQYDHKKTGIGCDLYILYKHSGYVWEYSGGGEKHGKGHCFPIEPPEYVIFEEEKVKAFPESWLEACYGDWKIPRLGDKGGKNNIKVPNNQNTILPAPT